MPFMLKRIPHIPIRICRLLMAGSLLVLSIGVNAHGIKTKHPMFSKYSPRQYNANRHIWDICQGKNGLVCFIAGDILLHGDNQWVNIPNKFGNVLRSIHSVSPDTLLIGGESLIGRIVETEVPGNYRFESLMPLLPEEYHDFGAAWNFLENNQGYYVRAGKALLNYQIHKDTITPVITGKFIEHISMAGDSLYVMLREEGLGILVNGQFQLLDNGTILKNKDVEGIYSTGNGQNMIITASSGLYIMQKGHIKPFESSFNKSLRKMGVEVTCRLGTDRIAIGTIKDGLYIIDKTGSLHQHISKETGLQSNSVLSMAVDYKKNLWLGLDKGIAYVETNSKFSIVNSPDDIGTGFVSAPYDDKLYLGTNQGLFVTDIERSGGRIRFGESIQPVENTTGQVWSLTRIDGKLYSGQHSGTFLIRGDKGIKVNDLKGVHRIKSLRNMEGYYLASTYRGLTLMKSSTSGNLIPVHKLNVPGDSREFIQDKYGFIWRTGAPNKAIRFSIDPKSHQADQVKTYSITYNNRTPSRIKVLGNAGNLLFSTNVGVFEFNHIRDAFVKNRFFEGLFPQPINFNQIFEDNYGRVWYSSRQEIGYYTSHLGEHKRVYVPFEKIKRKFTHSFGYINVFSKQDVLLPYADGFLYYDGASPESEIKNKNFQSYIMKASTNEKPIKRETSSNGNTIPVYSHANNSYHFAFSSNSFENSSDVRYSYFLEGFSKQWSGFSYKNQINFTNLREGRYTIKVKSKDIYGHISKPASFTFIIQPPFYRSLPAFILYGVLLVGLMILGFQIMKRQRRREREAMEAEKIKELREREEQFEREQAESWQRIINLENEKLQQEVKHKAKELSNSTLNLLHKNEVLQNIKSELQHLLPPGQQSQGRAGQIKKLIKTINKELNAGQDWEVFDSNLIAVHDEFVTRLKSLYPDLTPNDIRLCIFLRMNKSTKEIATLMNLSIRGVESSRYRLRKKLNLPRDESLTDVIMKV